jgi:hypothetical protein
VQWVWISRPGDTLACRGRRHSIWIKCNHSDSQGGACLEVVVRPRTIHIRDSKLGTRSPRFTVRCDAWTAFLGYASREMLPRS